MATAEAVLEVVELLATSDLRTVEAKILAGESVQCARSGIEGVLAEGERDTAEGLAAEVTTVLDGVGGVVTGDGAALSVGGETLVSAVLGLRLNGSVVSASSGGGGRG